MDSLILKVPTLQPKLRAQLIGVVFAKHSKRCVSHPLAKEIAVAANSVGVFYDEGINEIIECVEKTGINRVQLHGPGSRACLQLIPKNLKPILAVSSFSTHQESLTFEGCEPPLFLFDNEIPGSGDAFPLAQFSFKKRNPWILAGGLRPSNLEERIRFFRPDGVDSSTGVSDFCSLRKSPELVRKFIEIARTTFQSLEEK